MKKYAIILLCVITFVFSDDKTQLHQKFLTNFHDAHPQELFKVYHYLHKKSSEYNIQSDIGVKKFETFKINLEYIKKRNMLGLSNKLGINDFTDLTRDEFKAIYLMNPSIYKTARNDMNKYLNTDLNILKDLKRAILINMLMK